VLEVKESSSPAEITEKSLKFKELVAYQEGSVVSRTLINEQSGSVTVFAFDEGHGLTEHTAPYDALVFAMEGRVEITISGNVFNLNEGEMIIMPANKPHALKALTRFKMLLIMIRAK
jgi:quercetin dioxygenase-like cupin family protein